MTTPFVSVVIPNYNYARYVSQAIDSVLAQTYRHHEVIVINNGSTDNSAEVLRGYGDRIRWIDQENRGQSGARNRGIEESRGELIAFLDADDAWLPAKLERQIACLRDARIGLVYSSCIDTDASLKPLRVRLGTRGGSILRDMALSQITIIAGESTALVRRDCFERVGMFDLQLSLSAGWDMWRRIATHYKVGVVSDPLVFYRQHGTNMHRNVDLMEHDKLYSLAKMFDDPAAADVQPLRKQSYANVYLALCGSYLYAGQWQKSASYAIKSVITWPPALGYLAAFPLRHLRRLKPLYRLSDRDGRLYLVLFASTIIRSARILGTR